MASLIPQHSTRPTPKHRPPKQTLPPKLLCLLLASLLWACPATPKSTSIEAREGHSTQSSLPQSEPGSVDARTEVPRIPIRTDENNEEKLVLPLQEQPDATHQDHGQTLVAAEPSSEPLLSLAQASADLFPGEPQRPAELLLQCPSPASEAIACLLEALYADDDDARALALGLWQRYQTLCGVEETYSATVGWRGLIDFVPERPVGKYRKHLQWTVAALDEIHRVMTALETPSTANTDATPIPQANPAQPATQLRFRWTGLRLRFFRSVDRSTPSAYAHGWTVAYNVSGSLLKSERGVRETFFHELFHLNDAAHGDWSEQALTDIYEEILALCTQTESKPLSKCLSPYAPGSTKVKGGTYYAFQPGNDVREYAAELALRYFIEQRSVLAHEPPSQPFKCQNKLNKKAWELIVDEFFGGVDRVPPCDD